MAEPLLAHYLSTSPALYETHIWACGIYKIDQVEPGYVLVVVWGRRDHATWRTVLWRFDTWDAVTSTAAGLSQTQRQAGFVASLASGIYDRLYQRMSSRAAMYLDDLPAGQPLEWWHLTTCPGCAAGEENPDEREAFVQLLCDSCSQPVVQHRGMHPHNLGGCDGLEVKLTNHSPAVLEMLGCKLCDGGLTQAQCASCYLPLHSHNPHHPHAFGDVCEAADISEPDLAKRIPPRPEAICGRCDLSLAAHAARGHSWHGVCFECKRLSHVQAELHWPDCAAVAARLKLEQEAMELDMLASRNRSRRQRFPDAWDLPMPARPNK